MSGIGMPGNSTAFNGINGILSLDIAVTSFRLHLYSIDNLDFCYNHTHRACQSSAISVG